MKMKNNNQHWAQQLNLADIQAVNPIAAATSKLSTFWLFLT